MVPTSDVKPLAPPVADRAPHPATLEAASLYRGAGRAEKVIYIAGLISTNQYAKGSTCYTLASAWALAPNRVSDMASEALHILERMCGGHIENLRDRLIQDVSMLGESAKLAAIAGDSKARDHLLRVYELLGRLTGATVVKVEVKRTDSPPIEEVIARLDAAREALAGPSIEVVGSEVDGTEQENSDNYGGSIGEVGGRAGGK